MRNLAPVFLILAIAFIVIGISGRREFIVIGIVFLVLAILRTLPRKPSKH